jgi:hypothetical protein
MPTYIEKITASDLSLSGGDATRVLSTGSGTDTSFSVAPANGGGTETHFWVTASGVPNSDQWEADGSQVVEIEVDEGNTEINCQVRVGRCGASASILQTGSFTSTQVMSVSRVFNAVAPSWSSGEEACGNRYFVECLFTNNASHGTHSVGIGVGTGANEVVSDIIEDAGACAGAQVSVSAISAAAVAVAPSQVDQTVPGPTPVSAATAIPAVDISFDQVVGGAAGGDVVVRTVEFTFASGSVPFTQDVTVTGAGSCKGYILFYGNATSNGTETANGVLGAAVVGGSGSEATVSCWSADGAGQASCAYTQNETQVVRELSDEDTVGRAGEHSAFITDGFRLNWTTADMSGAGKAVLLFGDDVTCVQGNLTCAATDGQEALVSVGQQTDLLIAITRAWAAGGPDSAGTMCIGMASKVDASIAQGGIGWRDVDNQSPPDNLCNAANTRIAIDYEADITSGLVDNTWEVTTLDSSQIGITLHETGAVGGIRVNLLSVNFNGAAQYDVGALTLPTSTGSQSHTGVGFKPQFVLMGMSQTTAYVAESNSGDPHVLAHFGMADRLGGEHCIGLTSEDGAKDAGTFIDAQIVHTRDKDGAQEHAGSFVAFASDGWVVDYTAAPAAYVGFWAAIEEVATGIPVPAAAAAIVAVSKINRTVPVATIAAVTDALSPTVSGAAAVSVSAIAAPAANPALVRIDQTVPVSAMATPTAVVAPTVQQGQAISVGAPIGATATISAPAQIDVTVSAGPVVATTAISAPQIDQAIDAPATPAVAANLTPTIQQGQLLSVAAAISAAAAIPAPAAIDVTVPVGAISVPASTQAPQVGQSVDAPVTVAATVIVAPVVQLDQSTNAGAIPATAGISPPVQIDVTVNVTAIPAPSVISEPAAVAQTVSVTAVSALTAVPAPTVQQGQIASPSAVTATAAVVAPASVDQTVTIGAISAATAVSAPTVTFGDQNVDVTLSPAASPTVLAPQADQTAAVGAIAAGTGVVAPSTAFAVSIAAMGVTASISAPAQVDRGLGIPAIQGVTQIVAPAQIDQTILLAVASATGVVLSPSLGPGVLMPTTSFTASRQTVARLVGTR